MTPLKADAAALDLDRQCECGVRHVGQIRGYKDTLPKLIKAVEDGESVTIDRHGRPVVDIVRTRKPDFQKPKFATLKGKVTALDPDWWRPMTDDEVDALLNGG